MAVIDIEKTCKEWENIQKYLYVPRSESEYEYLVSILDVLIKEVRQNESHPLASLMDVIGTLIKVYEDENVPDL